MSATAPNLLDALRSTAKFAPEANAIGNLTLGRGRAGDLDFGLAIVENRIASGSLGQAEASALETFLQAASRSKSPVVLYLDSAGARVSEALQALGAFRRLFAAGLAASGTGVPMAAVLGRNCYGGASLLAHVASRRLFAPHSQLSMSGPAILAQAAGVSALDGMFRAMAESTLGAVSRGKQSPANAAWAPGFDLAAWLREALAPVAKPWTTLHHRHVALKARLPEAESQRAAEPVRRKDLEKLYAGDYEVHDASGLYTGRVTRGGERVPVLGLVGRTTVGAERAWHFAQAAWQLARNPPPRLELFLDCESHAPRLDDEKVVLSEYIVDMGAALAALALRGTKIELTVLGRAGGSVYVALASPASRVRTVYGAADIQVLPGSAVASILGESDDRRAAFDDYHRAGLADEELKLGLVP
ncbi:MAG: hypothetical protein IPJ28_19540 [Betaproteobacteria bacterium]|nr:hypothetical protein [Betaproteobacteria bacterium]